MKISSAIYSTRLMRIIAGMLVLCATLTAHAASIQWHSYSKSVFATAKAAHKEVLLYGYSPSCPFCMKMSSNTLTDAAVINFINQHYIAVKVNTTSNSAVASKYDIHAVPAILILSADSTVIKSIYGYVDASELTSKLE